MEYSYTQICWCLASRERDCKTAGLRWTEGPSYHTLSQYFRKVSNKQTTYSTSMTQEGATSSCDEQFKDKSELKLLLGAMAVERGRSHTARCWCHCPVSLCSWAIKWTPATAQPRLNPSLQLWTQQSLCPCSTTFFLQQTVANQRSRLVQTAAVPGDKHSPSLQGKPPKEGRHSPAMLKLLVQLKYKHCFY